MESIPPKGHVARVCIVTVTYGDRSHLLRRVLDAAQAADAAHTIGKIVVVDNGATAKTKAYLQEASAADPRIEVVSLERNLGSAAGFAAGLQSAVASGYHYTWLLDDDNLQKPRALSLLLSVMSGTPGECALVSLRADRQQFLRYARGEPRRRCFGGPNNFLGFAVSSRCYCLSNWLTSSIQPAPTATSNLLTLPYAPYGGLFFRTALLERVGYPRIDFVLYEDDHEFTLRFIRSGIPVFLLTESEVMDAEASWNSQGTTVASSPSPWLPVCSDRDVCRRIYYTARNRVYLETKYLVTNRLAYLGNMLALLGSLGVMALSVVARSRTLAPLIGYCTLLRGVFDGLRGRLGQPHRFQLV